MTLASSLAPLDKAILLLEDCRQFGTLAFAHAARAGFVAMSFLNSLVAASIIHLEDKQQFLNSIKTVSGEFENDAHQVAHGMMSADVFCARYGHLRPGTYDITMPAYWEDPERYLLGKTKNIGEVPVRKSYHFSDNAKEGMAKMLDAMDADISVDDFIAYLADAIKARESVKFMFTKNLSMALDQFIQAGQSVGLTREQLSYLQWEDFKQLRSGHLNTTMLESLIQHRMKASKMTSMIELPQLIHHELDFYCFERMVAQPNFVTTLSISAPVVTQYHAHEALRGAIVLVPQADPGYDWLFAHGIAGLVTQYGGANSHMAIRAAEMALPAVIGVGDKLYEELSRAQFLHLDCASQQVRGFV